MQLFNTKKPAADTAALDAAEEHKQSIGDQVMEALGVGDGAEERMHPEEDTEIMMPKKNQSQLAAEEMMKQHESICVISPDAVIKGGIEVKDAVMVAGRVMGDIVAAIVTCVGEQCYIEGNVKCAELQMHGGKIKETLRQIRRLSSMVPSKAISPVRKMCSGNTQWSSVSISVARS